MGNYSILVFTILILVTIVTGSCKKESTGPAEPEYPAGTKPIEASLQRLGDAEKGKAYLYEGDFIDSGIPYSLYNTVFGSSSENLLGRTGDNSTVAYDFTAANAFNGARIVTANCFQCHAQKLNGKLIIGLGDYQADFTSDNSENIPTVDLAIKLFNGENSKEWEAYQPFRRAVLATGPKIKTIVVGANPADKLAAVLAAYRSPDNLNWQDDPILSIPEEVIPADVPAWWILKKKNAMFAAGSGRGDFARLMMASSLLTLQDSTKARVVDENFADVLAFINTLEAPPYPGQIDLELAARGEEIFNESCAKCHGHYGATEDYPNLLVSLDVVKTDPALAATNNFPEYIDWFKDSWFAQDPFKAQMVFEAAYIAPPLDGIWATAPYLHNGSVPSLKDLLDSSERPSYFKRILADDAYDYEKVGWQYTIEDAKTDKRVYDTNIPGYGNQGHTFGDNLSDQQRQELIEYLKTL